MGKENQIIMAIERDVLFGNDYFQGFRPTGEVDYESRILANFKWMRRGDIEYNPQIKQPTVYSFIVSPKLKKLFVYQRAEGKTYDEEIGRGRWSWGVGGHIDKEKDSIHQNPIWHAFARELDEEVEIFGAFFTRSLGCINYDAEKFSSVHFGFVHLVETNASLIIPKDPEIAEGRLMIISELEEILSNKNVRFDEWSLIALPFLRKILA